MNPFFFQFEWSINFSIYSIFTTRSHCFLDPTNRSLSILVLLTREALLLSISYLVQYYQPLILSSLHVRHIQLVYLRVKDIRVKESDSMLDQRVYMNSKELPSFFVLVIFLLGVNNDAKKENMFLIKFDLFSFFFCIFSLYISWIYICISIILSPFHSISWIRQL